MNHAGYQGTFFHGHICFLSQVVPIPSTSGLCLLRRPAIIMWVWSRFDALWPRDNHWPLIIGASELCKLNISVISTPVAECGIVKQPVTPYVCDWSFATTLYIKWDKWDLKKGSSKSFSEAFGYIRVFSISQLDDVPSRKTDALSEFRDFRASHVWLL